MIDLGLIPNDPDLAQNYTILRSNNNSQWLTGTFQSQTEEVPGFGVVSVASLRDLEMVPEGDVVHGAMAFWSSRPIYGTRATQGQAGLASDILVWRGENYRVLNVAEYRDYGYWKAIATRMVSG